MWRDANIPTQGDKSTCRRQAPSSAEHVPSPPIDFGAQPLAWCAIPFQILITVLAACGQVFMPTPAQTVCNSRCVYRRTHTCVLYATAVVLQYLRRGRAQRGSPLSQSRSRSALSTRCKQGTICRNLQQRAGEGGRGRRQTCVRSFVAWERCMGTV